MFFNFKDMELLGQGTYATVYKGNNLAYKVSKPNSSNSLAREAKLLQNLRHRNIIEIKQYRVNPECIELELMDTTLEEHLKRFKVDERRALHFAYHICLGLQYLAEQHIVHRDIKPANLLLNKNLTCLKLADFGSAVYSDDQTHFSGAVTRFYRPPELLLQEGYVLYNESVDVWSAGCVVVEIFSKRALFGQSQDEEWQVMQMCSLFGAPNNSMWPNVESMYNYRWCSHASRKGPPACPDLFAALGTPPLIFDIVKGMLQMNPAHRITARTASQHLGSLLRHMPADRSAESSFESTSEPADAYIPIPQGSAFLDRYIYQLDLERKYEQNECERKRAVGVIDSIDPTSTSSSIVQSDVKVIVRTDSNCPVRLQTNKLLALNCDDGSFSGSGKVVDVSDDGQTKFVTLLLGQYKGSLVGHRCEIYAQFDASSNDRKRAVMQRLRDLDRDQHLSNIQRVLLGQLIPNSSPIPPIASEFLEGDGASLNDRQRTALQRSLYQPITVVHGPVSKSCSILIIFSCFITLIVLCKGWHRKDLPDCSRRGLLPQWMFSRQRFSPGPWLCSHQRGSACDGQSVEQARPRRRCGGGQDL